jgi:hypothetical protein
MSSIGRGSGGADQQHDDDIALGLTVVGITIAFLFGMVICRCGCNIFIDVIILRDTDSLLRSLSEFRRRVIPCWHPRTQPQEVIASGEESSTREIEIISMDRVLSGLTPLQKQELLSSILTSRIVTMEDAIAWEEGKNPQLGIPDGSSQPTEDDSVDVPSNASTTTGVICPICIDDIEVGDDAVFLSVCNHVFHNHCISQCLSTNTRNCPYCRAEIITQEMMEQAYIARNLHHNSGYNHTGTGTSRTLADF